MNSLDDGAVLIDTDLMRNYVPDYIEMASNPATSHKASDFSHESAKLLASSLADYAFKNNYNVIQDGILSNFERSDANFAKAKQAGYSPSIKIIAVYSEYKFCLSTLR